MDILQEICRKTNQSWGIDVLIYDSEMRIQLSQIFMDMFACLFCKGKHVNIRMGFDENGRCFTYANLDYTTSTGVTLSLYAPSFTHTLLSSSAYNNP